MQEKSLLECIGNTPLVSLQNINPYHQHGVKLFAKLESSNPCGSVKDRPVAYMIKDAEKTGKLKRGGTIVEETSGNTGMAATLMGLSRGYKVVLLMPQKASEEKQKMLRAAGATVIVTPNCSDPKSPDYYVNIRKKIVEETPGAFFLDQFNNMSNIKSHMQTTGPEIWKQTSGKVTHFIAGAGTGGTLLGTTRYLKKRNPVIQSIMADPKYKSGYHDYWRTGTFPSDANYEYLVEGIGENFLATIFEKHVKLIDDVVLVDDRSSFKTSLRLLTEEGIFGGGSSGANVFASLEVAKKLFVQKKRGILVTIICDSGKSYISKLYNPKWRKAQGFDF